MTVLENESSESNVVTPKNKYIRKNKTALAHVLLLDGSHLDIQIDVKTYFYIILLKLKYPSIYFHFNSHKLC